LPIFDRTSQYRSGQTAAFDVAKQNMAAYSPPKPGNIA
jgi:hypothetical protein